MNTFEIRLDFNSKVSLTDQLREKIRAQILAGVLLPGDPLPTVRELAAQLGINFNTVARAYRGLDMEGIITTRQGRGTFVRETAQDVIAAAWIEIPDPESELDRQQRLDALVAMLFSESDRLDIPRAMLHQALLERVQAGQVPTQTVRPARISAVRHRPGSKAKRMQGKVEQIVPGIPGTKRSPKKRNVHPSMFHVKQ